MIFAYVFEGKDITDLRESIQLVEHFYPDATIVISTHSQHPFLKRYLLASATRQSANKHIDQYYKFVDLLARLDEPFMMMNDDFMLLGEIQDDGDYGVSLKERIERQKHRDSQYHMLVETEKILEKHNLTTHSFELHKPIYIDDDVAREMIFEIEEPGLYRSLYGNYALAHDVPLHQAAFDPKNDERATWVISHDPGTRPHLRHLWENLL